ncbi:hypothetical protein [Pseudooceanicola sp.]|uniref:hypothetical protein n=1 Tax=Pseudooceanicola sp. TaxID=1914328 RepID=UPI0035C72872
MTRPDKLAYLLDAEQLAGIFAEWPDEMNVALCLDDRGGCEVMVYHQAEGRGVLRKVASVMDRPLGTFVVVPEVKGYPTRKVMFSEEQKLLSLVADAWDLPETATDYAINYRFALDQGLDPETMKPRAPKPATAEVITPTFRHRRQPGTAPRPAPTQTATAVAEAPAEVLPAKRSRLSVRPRLRLSMGGLARKLAPEPEPVAEVAESRHPAGYYPAEELAKSECHVLDGQIFAHEDCIRVVISRDKMSVNTKPVKATEVLFRDDFVRFMMPREVLAGWEPDQAAVLDIPAALFPAPLAGRYREFARYADVSVTDKGVFVGPIDRIENWRPLEARPRPLLRRVLTPARAAVLAMVGIGALAGTVISSVDPNGERISGFFDGLSGPATPEVTRSIGTPLDLIGTLAREEALGQGK